MQSFVGVSHLLSVLLLQLVPAQISHPPELGHSKVMAFQEVWAKSLCRPMEQLVDVEHEYPGEVEFIYMPACVPLWRCSGCCGDENLECQAMLERNVTLQVMRIHPMLSMHHVELTFVEHQRCECRLRQKPTNNKRSVDELFIYRNVKTSISSVHFAPPPQQQRLYQEQTEEEETQEDSKRLWKVPVSSKQD